MGRPLDDLIASLAQNEIDAGNAPSAGVLTEFGRLLESRGFFSQEAVTLPTVYLNTMEEMMDEVQGLDAGLRALFKQALLPAVPGGHAWPVPPQLHENTQKRTERRKVPAPTWDCAAKFPPMSLPPGAPIPTLTSMGVFDGLTHPAASGTKLDNKGFILVNERAFSAAQCDIQLQGGGITERVKVAWERELSEWSPPHLMPWYGKKVPW